MTLRRLFLLISLTLSLLVLGLASRMVVGELSNWREADSGLEAMQRLQLGLVTAEMASRERGPSNGLMGASDTANPENAARLRTARERTDAAWGALQTALKEHGDTRPKVTESVNMAHQTLLRGRASVDDIAALPRSQRKPEAISAAVGQMFAVISGLDLPLAMLMEEARRAYPAVGDALVAARLAAELREYAGQLGSQFTVALSTQQALRDEERVAIERLRGRIDQLRKLLMLAADTHQDRPAVKLATAHMTDRYVDHALPFVEALARKGETGGPYGIDAAMFAARYVPDMDAIVNLRNVMMELALNEASRERDRAQTALAWVSAAGVITLVLLVATLWVVRHRVVQPLSDTTALIVALAQGDLDRAVPAAETRDEMADMLRAIGVLKEHGLARRQLEHERQHLIDQLRDQSNTDYLTGLPNRRGFFALANTLIANLARLEQQAAVALLDVDHFKRVNDTHGHAVGDTVLIEVGKRCRTLCRMGDVVARYGGEEFLILMPQCSYKDALVQTERLRSGLQSMEISLPNGQLLRVTASFGVAACLPTDLSVEDAIERADDALYEAKHLGRNQVFGTA